MARASRAPNPSNSSKVSYQRMLQSLRDWIKGLNSKDTGATVWQHYAETTTYETEEQQAKKRFVAEFSSQVKPNCSGTSAAIPVIFPKSPLVQVPNGYWSLLRQCALERGYARAKAKKLRFLPLFQDGANPAPGSGLGQSRTQEPRETRRRRWNGGARLRASPCHRAKHSPDGRRGGAGSSHLITSSNSSRRGTRRCSSSSHSAKTYSPTTRRSLRVFLAGRGQVVREAACRSILTMGCYWYDRA